MISSLRLFRRACALAAVSFLFPAGWLAAPAFAEPTISNVSVRALTIGAPQTLVIEGAELLPDPKLLLPAPLAASVMQPGATANRVAFDLKVADHANPGVYALRLASGQGASNAVLMAVDRLATLPLAEQTTAALPVALSGVVGGEARVRTTVAGKKGQTLIADVECQRLGGSFRPVLRLYDPRGVQLAWSAPSAALGGDSRLTALLPVDGPYVVEVHDVLFRAPGPGFFRLKLGALSFADGALPSGVTLGQQAALELRRGNVAAGTRIDFDARALNLPGEYPATWAAAAGGGPLTGIAPRILVDEFAHAVEPSEPATGPRPVPAAPVTVHGVLSKPGEEDRFAIPVTPGAKLRVEMQAQSLGAPVDGVLTVVAPNGAALGSNDDRPGTADPAVDVTVPGDANQVIVVVRDMEGQGGADSIYRILVRDSARPDFTLPLPADRVSVPAGGSRLLTLPIVRQGAVGSVVLDVPGLPAGVQLAGQTIEPHHGVALFSLSAPAGAAPNATLTSLVGKSTAAQPPLVRAGQVAETPALRLQPWLRRELAVAVAPAAPLSINWLPAADEKLPLGGKLAVNVQIARAANLAGPVRVRLVTSQIVPKKTVKENNKDVQVDDVDKALRLESDLLIAADKNDATTAILVPADLPPGAWNVALTAELLGPDGKAIVTSAHTPVRTLPAVK